MSTKFIQKALSVFILALFAFGFLGQEALAAARDCDGNAVIYCGTITKTELKNKLNKGTGKPYQSSAKLKSLYARYGFEMSDISKLKNGKVTRGNNVYVGDKKVASNVYTFGRHNIAGSKKVSGLSYPLYKRHPSVSFLSSSLDAYVYLNYDGSMAYAIIKSCGNPVQGVGKRVKPAEVPDIPPAAIEEPAPATEEPPTVAEEVRVPIIIEKYYDTNQNGLKNTEEVTLPGWQFNVRGPRSNQTVTTGETGQVVLTNMPLGDYIITEINQAGWRNTTGLSISRRVTAEAETQAFVFGNYQIPEDEPLTPGGGDATPPPARALPVSGVKEVSAIIVAILFSLAAILYFASRAYLKMVLHGKLPPTDPRKLVKELQKRLKEKNQEKRRAALKVVQSEKEKSKFRKNHGL